MSQIKWKWPNEGQLLHNDAIIRGGLADLMFTVFTILAWFANYHWDTRYGWGRWELALQELITSIG